MAKLRNFRKFSELTSAFIHDFVLEEGQYKVISFDVFDTLIHRKMAPELVVLGIANRLKEIIASKGLTPKDDLLATRHIAHQKIMSQLDLNALDEDLIIQEWAPVWVQESIFEDVDSKSIQEISEEILKEEIEHEKKVCFANPWMAKALNELKLKGEKLIAISDMYLGEDFVSQLLEEMGFLEYFDQVYVSGDYRKLKRTGKLFKHVKNELDLDYETWLHVGDNAVADGEKPNELGISSWIINDEELHSILKAQKFDFHNAFSVPGWGGLVAASYARTPPGILESKQEAYGKRVLGPIFSSFIHGVAERSKELGIKKVFFFAREGMLLKDLFDKSETYVFKDDNTSKPESVYLGISRLTVFGAAMHGYGIREFAAAVANTGHYSIETLFSPLKLDREFLQKIANQNGLGDVTVPLPPDFLFWSPLHRFLDTPELKEVLEDRYKHANKLLNDYLNQEGFFDHDRVAVVDVGWSGQIQDNLVSAVRDRLSTKVVGFYLGITEQAHSRTFEKSYLEPILADKILAGWSSNAIFDFVFAPEVASRAPHGTTVGYEYTGEQVVPVFKPEETDSRKQEKLADGFISALQKGITSYCDEYFECCHMINLSYLDTRPYANAMIERMVRFPTSEEATWWMDVKNVSDLGSDEVLGLVSNESKRLLISPRKLTSALRSTFWRYGLLGKIAGRPAQLIFLILDQLRTLKHRSIVYGEPKLLSLNLPAEQIATTNNSCQDELVASCHLQSKLNYDAQRKKDNLVQGFKHTSELSVNENLWLVFGHKIINSYSRLRKLNCPVYDGVSIKYLIKRNLYAKNGNKKFITLILSNKFVAKRLKSK